MYKRTIEYTDYDGQVRKEDFYFNLNKSELMMWLTTSGDYTLDKMMLKLQREHNGKEIMKIFYDLIYMSYGEKSVDGRRFIKTEEVKNNFMETEAFSELFAEIVQDANKAVEFIKGVLPQSVLDGMNDDIIDSIEGIDDQTKNQVKAAITKQ